MKTVIIDGIKFYIYSDREVCGRLTYDIKIVSLKSTQGGRQYLVWSNIPNLELSGIKMDIWELNSYELILKTYNYAEIQKLYQVKKRNNNDEPYVSIVKYARIQNP